MTQPSSDLDEFLSSLSSHSDASTSSDAQSSNASASSSSLSFPGRNNSLAPYQTIVPSLLVRPEGDATPLRAQRVASFPRQLNFPLQPSESNPALTLRAHSSQEMIDDLFNQNRELRLLYTRLQEKHERLINHILTSSPNYDRLKEELVAKMKEMEENHQHKLTMRESEWKRDMMEEHRAYTQLAEDHEHLKAAYQTLQADHNNLLQRFHALSATLEKTKQALSATIVHVQALKGKTQEQESQIQALEGKTQSQERQLRELGDEKLSSAVTDKIADVFQFFCKRTINKVRKSTQELRTNFRNDSDIPNELSREADDDPSPAELQRKTLAENVIAQQLQMDVEVVKRLNELRGHRGVLRHFIDNKRYSDEEYMTERIAEFQQEMMKWGEQVGETEFAESVIDWSRKALQYSY